MSASQRLRAPQQARSRESLERIYQAVNLISGEKAFDRLTVSEIAKAADVAVGTIYQRFATKDDLLLELYEHYIREAVSAVDNLIFSTSTATRNERVKNIIQIVSDLFLSHRGIVRSFVLKYRSDPNEVPDNYYREIDAVVGRVDKYLQAGEISQRQAEICRSFIIANCREHVLFESFQGFAKDNPNAEFRGMLETAAIAILAMDRDGQ